MDFNYSTPGNFKKWYSGLIIVGILTLILGFIFLHPFSSGHGDDVSSTRFWAVLLMNAVYWLLLVNVALFFIAISTLAMGSWQVSFRRVNEAISSTIPVLGAIALIVMLCLVFGNRTDIYHWLDKEAVQSDKLLNAKKGFLNPAVYLVFSFVVVGLWAFFSRKFNKISRDSDEGGTMDFDTSKKWMGKNMSLSAYYTALFILSVGSIAPWLWLMSIDPHWYSTMYSWYTFASTFVAGMALITIFTVYFKNQGVLPYTNKEHIHDLGKYMFAFSIFWTYLWFDQFMLIWYGNIPEETVYFKIRLQGAYKGIFYLNLLINFIAPFLIFMKAAPKRNFTIVTFMAAVIIFGHWIDFYQMVMPGTVYQNPSLGWFEFGIALGFVGVIMWGVSRFAEKTPMVAKNNPFLKESIVHHV